MTGLVKIGGQTERLVTAITGVVPSHRRRGIATALKVTSLQQAQKLGTHAVKTDNEENNPMYQINRRLGFMLQPAILEFSRQH
jgi:GNAT superfamily N-acetyltransferase